jgi:asparagine synthase (glutamine-hydrolysing)
MCGIVALFSWQGSVSTAALERAVARLHHRGPDGQAVWQSADGRVALGHARLSIIDLETGAQPIASADEQLQIVVNGEFYDYERERLALERQGHRFRTRSDSEIALHLYEDLGIDCVRRLRGEFAFAIWDSGRRRLVACRDRYGVKPLYYSLHEGQLFLASEVKALFAAGVPARWDAEGVALGVALRGPARTAFEGVRAVPPGHCLIADPDGLRLAPYWDIAYPPADAAPQARSEEDWVEGFRVRLDEAVRLRLRADVPVACYLSGGLDSAAILGLAARHRSDRVQAFTLRFDQPDYDEGAIAEEMAACAGADYRPVAVTAEDLADHFSDAVFHAEASCTNVHGAGKYLLSRAVRNAGFKVVLTGEGADEVLAGYPHFRLDLLLRKAAGKPSEQDQRDFEALYGANKVSWGFLLPRSPATSPSRLASLLGFLPAWLHQFVNERESRLLPYRAEFFRVYDRGDPSRQLLADLDVAALAGQAPLHQALYLWAKTMLPNYILATLGDRMEMAHSVEGRLPFLDHEVGEFLQGVPPELMIRGTTEKYLLREAVRDLVTPTLYRRQKHPFLAPPPLLRPGSRFFELLRDTVNGSAAAAVPFFDAPAVRRVIDTLPQLVGEQRAAAERSAVLTLSTILLHQRLGLSG